jgi:hypothetical protein
MFPDLRLKVNKSPRPRAQLIRASLLAPCPWPQLLHEGHGGTGDKLERL